MVQLEPSHFAATLEKDLEGFFYQVKYALLCELAIPKTNMFTKVLVRQHFS